MNNFVEKDVTVSHTHSQMHTGKALASKRIFHYRYKPSRSYRNHYLAEAAILPTRANASLRLP
jgi:hypothetical protein